MNTRLKRTNEGFWGLIGREFTLDALASLCRAVSLQIPEDGGVVVGYDTRFLSEQAAEAVIEAVRPHRPVFVLSHFSSSPEVSFATRILNLPLGILLTGSHLPGDFHGVRFFARGGFPMDLSSLSELPNSAPSTPSRHPVESISIQERYLEQLLQGWDKESFAQKRMHIVVDSFWGGDGALLERLGEALNMSVALLHPNRDVLFGGAGPDVSEGNLRELKEQVRKMHSSCGIALAGARNRIGVVLENAEVAPSHSVLLLLLSHLFEQKGQKGGIVRTAGTSQLIQQFALAQGVETARSAPGAVHLTKRMKQNGLRYGVDEPVMLVDAHHLWVSDAYRSMLILLETLAFSEEPLSGRIRHIQERFGKVARKRIDLLLPEAERNQIMRRFRTYPILDFLGWNIKEVWDAQGIGYSFEGGRNFLIRPATTEPVLRLYLEAPREEEVFGMEKKLLEFIRGEG